MRVTVQLSGTVSRNAGSSNDRGYIRQSPTITATCYLHQDENLPALDSSRNGDMTSREEDTVFSCEKEKLC